MLSKTTALLSRSQIIPCVQAFHINPRIPKIHSRGIHLSQVISATKNKPDNDWGNNLKNYLFMPNAQIKGQTSLKLSRSEFKQYCVPLLMLCTEDDKLQIKLNNFNKEDSFFSWFLLTEIKIWILSVHLARYGEQGIILRNYVIDNWWKDCMNRAKQVGEFSIGERSKQIYSLAEEFQTSLVIYDNGVLGSDHEMANAIWRRFFLANEDPDFENIAKIVKFIRQSVQKIENYDIRKIKYFEWPEYDFEVSKK